MAVSRGAIINATLGCPSLHSNKDRFLEAALVPFSQKRPYHAVYRQAGSSPPPLSQNPVLVPLPPAGRLPGVSMPPLLPGAVGKKGARRHHLAIGREKEEGIRGRGRPP